MVAKQHGWFFPRSVGRTLVVFYSHPRVCSVQYRMLHSELESLMHLRPILLGKG